MSTSPRFPLPAPAPLPRRAALGVFAAAGALALAGCSGEPPAGPDPLLADIADTEQLLSVYDRVLRAHAPLAARLRPLRANHAAHLNALRSAAGVSGSASPSPSAG